MYNILSVILIVILLIILSYIVFFNEKFVILRLMVILMLLIVSALIVDAFMYHDKIMTIAGLGQQIIELVKLLLSATLGYYLAKKE